MFVCVGACLQRCLCAYSTPRNLSLSAFVFMFSFSRQGKKNDCKQSAWAKGEQQPQQRRSGSTWSQSRPQRSAASTACLPLTAPSLRPPLASPLQGFVLWLLLRVWPAAACANLSTAANIYTRITPPSTYLPLYPSTYLPSSPPSTTPLAGFFIEFVRQQIALDTWRRLLLLLVAEGGKL